MSIASILSAVAFLGTLVLSVEGVNLATDGDIYLASLKTLAQMEERVESVAPAPVMEPAPAIAPMPPQNSGSLPPPPPPPNGTFNAFPAGQEGSSGSMPPPPMRPAAPDMNSAERQKFMQEGSQPPPLPPAGGRQFRQPPPMPPKGQSSQPPRNEFRNESSQPPRNELNEFEEGQGDFEEQGEFEERIDPRKLRQVVQEIQKMKSQIKSLLRQLQKAGTSNGDASTLTGIGTELDALLAVLSDQSADVMDVRDAIQEFRDSDYRDTINEIKTKLELPKELKQTTNTIKRLKKILRVKSAQAIIDVARLGQKITEMEQVLAAAQSAYSSGDFESAKEELQVFHDEGNPGDIESTFYRLNEIKNRLKRVKDVSIRSQVEELLQEVVSLFNEGNYREARELMEQNQRTINQLLSSSNKPR